MSVTTVDEGRYRLEGVVGRGGMALVYRAVDREQEEPVAIKMLADNLAADPELASSLGERGHGVAAAITWDHVVDRLIDAGSRSQRVGGAAAEGRVAS